MPLSLQEFANGDTNYIAKHNANVQALVSFINSIESTLASVSGASTGLANSSNIGKATYGASGMNLIGESSYSYTTNNTTGEMTVAGGFCWDAGAGIMHYKSGSTVLAFAGLANGTYYVRLDGNSTPFIDTITTNAIYSIAWAGGSFGTITRLANLTLTATDLSALAYSVYSGQTYVSVASRLDATENAFSEMLTVDLGIGDYQPPVKAVMETIALRLIGSLGGSRTLTIPAKPKVYLIRNECTGGAFNINITTGSGSVAQLLPGVGAVVHCDGTNVRIVTKETVGSIITTFLGLSDTPSTFAGMAGKMLVVNQAANALEFVDLPATPPPAAALAVQDEGLEVDAATETINFVGNGVTVTQTAVGQVQVEITGGGGGGGSSSLQVNDEGSLVSNAVVLINFTGDGVTVTQTATGQIAVNIPGGTGGGGSGAQPISYDLSFFLGGKQPSNEVAFRHTFTKPVQFLANWSGSDGDAITAPIAQAVYKVNRNGLLVGNIVFEAGSVIPTFTTAGGVVVDFVAGDILELVTPNPRDEGLTGVSLTLSGERN